jgi:anti-anti-sigma regulatory factor
MVPLRQLDAVMLLSFQTMLKITTRVRPESLTFVLEGRLCRPWTDEVERGWTELVATAGEKKLLLDLEGVTFVDRDGEALLASIVKSGTQVRASGVLVRHIVQQMRGKASGKLVQSSRGTPSPRRERGMP